MWDVLLKAIQQQLLKNVKKSSKGEEITPESQELSIIDIGSALLNGGSSDGSLAQDSAEAIAPEAPTDIQAEAPSIPANVRAIQDPATSFDQGDVMATPTGQVKRSFEPIPQHILNRNWQDVPSTTKLTPGVPRGIIDALTGQGSKNVALAGASQGRKTAYAAGQTIGDLVRTAGRLPISSDLSRQRQLMDSTSQTQQGRSEIFATIGEIPKMLGGLKLTRIIPVQGGFKAVYGKGALGNDLASLENKLGELLGDDGEDGGRRKRAKDALETAGRRSTDKDIDEFIKLNPGF